MAQQGAAHLIEEGRGGCGPGDDGEGAGGVPLQDPPGQLGGEGGLAGAADAVQDDAGDLGADEVCRPAALLGAASDELTGGTRQQGADAGGRSGLDGLGGGGVEESEGPRGSQHGQGGPLVEAGELLVPEEPGGGELSLHLSPRVGDSGEGVGGGGPG